MGICSWFAYHKAKEAKHAPVAEALEGSVEQVGRGGRHTTAEERLPGEAARPEGGEVLHGKEQSSDRRVEGCCYTGRHPGCGERPSGEGRRCRLYKLHY